MKTDRNSILFKDGRWHELKIYSNSLLLYDIEKKVKDREHLFYRMNRLINEDTTNTIPLRVNQWTEPLIHPFGHFQRLPIVLPASTKN